MARGKPQSKEVEKGKKDGKTRMKCQDAAFGLM